MSKIHKGHCELLPPFSHILLDAILKRLTVYYMFIQNIQFSSDELTVLCAAINGSGSGNSNSNEIIYKNVL